MLSTNCSLYLSKISLQIPPLTSVDNTLIIHTLVPTLARALLLFLLFHMHFSGLLEFL